MNFENLMYEVDDQLAVITINRPKKLNALNKETIQELHDAFAEADQDADIGVIILTGSGEKAFVAGADISEFSDFEEEEGAMLARKGQKILFDFYSFCISFFGDNICHTFNFIQGRYR